MIAYKIVPHSSRKIDVVEVWMDEHMVATFYANDEHDGIRLISKHFDDVTMDKRTAPVDVLSIGFKWRG